MAKRAAVTKIVVLGETWRVPRGFGRAYRDAARHDLELARKIKPGEVIGQIRDVLSLVGYTASIEAIADWPLRKRVEAVVWTATEYARAGDHPVRRHPLPTWLKDLDPWKGPPRDVSRIRKDLRGAFEGPGPTEIPA